MKKMIYTTIATAVLTASSFADQGSLLGIQLGYSSNEVNTLDTTEDKRGGLYLDYDFIGMIDSIPGFGLGVGMDINAWTAKDGSGISDGKSMYTMGATVKAGYTFENNYDLPLKIKGGIGYGLLDIGVHDAWGLQYEGNAEYTLYKGIGIGVKYKHAEASMLGTTIDIDSTIAFISFGKDK